MYNFTARRNRIIAEAKECGVTVVLVADKNLVHGVLQFSGEFRGSESVRKYLERRMKTYNEHSRKGI